MRIETWKKGPAPADYPFRKRLMAVANVPQRKWESTLDQADPVAAGVVQDYIESLKERIEAGDGLLLWGKYRVGKSCLAACVAREAVAHRARAYWLDASDLADCWMERDGYFVQARSAHLLVVDDLGVEGGVEFRAEMIGRALRYRLERGMATVLTTNMAPLALKNHYGGKIVALLREVQKAVEVMPWAGAERGMMSETTGETVGGLTEEQKRAEAEMRQMSGAVDDDRPLVALLFVLMRDHITPGAMETIFENHVAVANGQTQEYSNGWLARHAQDLARRLGVGP